MRLKGDGKNYQFRMKHKSSDYFSYIYTFSTSGDWQVIEMKLSDFFQVLEAENLINRILMKIRLSKLPS